MNNLIKPNTCSTCAHHFRDGQELQCRARPPTAHPIVTMTPKGPQLAGIITAFPVVKADQWCSEHKILITKSVLEQ